MTTYSAKRFVTILIFVLTLGLSGCGFVAPPPDELLAKQDHVALAAWYQNEAVRLRQKAKEMEQMAEEYGRDRERAEQKMSHGSRKADFVQECKRLAAAYTTAAKEAETLAQSHRDVTAGRRP